MKIKLLTLLFLFSSFMPMAAEDEIVSFKLTSENGLPDNNIREIEQDSLLGYIYLKGRYDTYRYDGYQFQKLSSEEAKRIHWRKTSQGNRPGDVFRDNLGNRLELKSSGDLLYADQKSGKQIMIHLLSPSRFQLTQRLKCSVITDKEGRIWIGTNSTGMVVYDKRTGQVHRITKDAPERLINSNYIVSMLYDRDGAVWVATEHHGVARLKARDRHYRIVNFSDSEDEMVNKIRMLERLDDGRILIADMIGTLRVSTDDMQSFKTLSQHGENYISACMDGDGNLWLGSRLHGVNIGGKNYGNGRTDCIVRDHKGRMWTCGLKNGLRQAMLQDGELKERKFLVDQGRLDARVMYVDHKGDIWLGTKMGLYVFNPDRLLANPKDYKKVADWPVMCLYERANHELWVGTSGHGVFYGDNSQNPPQDFKAITTADGLANNAVQLIIEDDGGNLYIGTEDGCSYVNAKNRQILNLYFNDNLLLNTTNERCVVRLSDGSMAFGTLDGIVITKETMPQPRKARPLLMTNFLVNGMPLSEVAPFEGDISEQQDITLDFNQNFIEASFSNMNYGENRQTTLLYRLDGYDEDWTILGKDNTVGYKKLRPGSYTLHVKSKETGEVADSEEYVLHFTIRSPWWATWWAIILYLLAAGVLATFVYKYLRDMYRMRRDIEVERKLTDYKLRFFTNITHEFRTPLTLIQGAMERIGDLKAVPGNLQQPISNMHRSVDRMLRLVNQLLEFRRMQNNKLSLSLQETEIVGFLRDIFMNFHDVAENRRISYNFNTNQKTLTGYIDRGHIDKIVFNLLSNAFKYTPIKGEISLNVRSEESRVYISVKDTGIGIAKDKQPELFTRFSTGKVKSDSLGIGLNLTKELVNIHHGSITYSDNTPQGSIFTFDVPIGKEDYKAEDFMVTEPTLITDEPTEGSKGYQEKYREVMPEPMNECQVLIVEDDVDVAEMLSRELGSYFRVILSNDGQEALEQLRAEGANFDLVVSDVMMPRMNGFELTKAIRADKQLQHLPIVLLTALSSEEKQERGMTVGADAYIAKPFSLRLLIAQCCNLLNQRLRLKAAFATLPQQKETAIPEVIKEEKDRKFIDLLDRYIYGHIKDETISVDVMAEHFGYGRTTFYNKVRDLTGVTPNEYLKNIRLMKAAELLRESDNITVGEVCWQVGFGNPQYFATNFKKKFGMTPKEYQKGK